MSALDLAAARSHLNITAETHDAEITTTIEAAEGAIASLCGPLEPVTRTERVRGGRPALTLLVTPVVTLTSVTALDGTTLTVDDLFVSPHAGRVTRTDGSLFSAAFYDVVYSCGRTECPPGLLLAVKEMLRHLWDTQRGGSRRPGSQQSEALSNSLPGSAYTFPNRVTELMTPHMQVKG